MSQRFTAIHIDACPSSHGCFCSSLFFTHTPQDESLTYQGQLDKLEAELLKYRAELNSMQSINSNALQSKEEAKVSGATVNN